jgi:hypothetical protein
MEKGLQRKKNNSDRHGNGFKVCAMTHTSALIANAPTYICLNNIYLVNYTYPKLTVENFK